MKEFNKNIMLMRNIDTWVGVPVCFLLSVLNKIGTFFRSDQSGNERAPKKILIIKLAELGAIILSYPLLNKLRRQYPDSEIFFLTFQKNKCVFEVMDNIVNPDNVLTISKQSLWTVLKDTVKAVRYLRKKKIDMVLDLEFFSRFTMILSYISGASGRVGYSRYNFEGLYRGDLLTHNVRYNTMIHIAESYLSMAQVMRERNVYSPDLGEAIEDGDVVLPRCEVHGAARSTAANILNEHGLAGMKRIVLMSPGEGPLPLREWPLENFICLARKMLDDKDTAVLIIGADGSSEKAGQMLDALQHARCVNLSGRTTLKELLALFELSHILIINDCGLAHLASLTGIKQFVLFGPETPIVFGPLGDNNVIIHSGSPCSPCFSVFNHRNSACRNNRCLKKISVDEVYEAIAHETMPLE